MDGESLGLEKKLENLLREAAEVSVALDRANGTIQGVPHYSVIEGRAHELGRQLSRQIQQRQMAEIVGRSGAQGDLAQDVAGTAHLIPTKRSVTSVDGALATARTPGLLPVVSAGFFSPSGDAGV